MIKKFYYFPYKIDPPYILYDSEDILKSNLFRALLSKIGSNSIKLRIRKNKFVSCLVKWLYKTNINVPNRNIRIIYHGFDNNIFFEFYNESKKVKKVYLEEKGKLEVMEFFGVPPFYDFYGDKIKNAKLLKKFLQNHWDDLKHNRTKLHGDLTIFNILLKNNKIKLIDHYPVNNSKIFDHFYFYFMFLQKIYAWKGNSLKNKNKIKKALEDMYAAIFINESKDELVKLVEQIKVEDAKGLWYKPTAKKRFLDLINRIKDV